MNSKLYFSWDKDGIPTFGSPTKTSTVLGQEAQECTEALRGFGYAELSVGSGSCRWFSGVMSIAHEHLAI